MKNFQSKMFLAIIFGIFVTLDSQSFESNIVDVYGEEIDHGQNNTTKSEKEIKRLESKIDNLSEEIKKLNNVMSQHDKNLEGHKSSSTNLSVVLMWASVGISVIASVFIGVLVWFVKKAKRDLPKDYDENYRPEIDKFTYEVKKGIKEIQDRLNKKSD